MTFSMVAQSLFGAQLKDEDIDLVSHTISTVQEFIVRQTLQPYLNPWFAVSGELRKHEEMRVRADSILLEYIKQSPPPGARPRSAADPDGCPLQRRRRHER